MSIDERLVQILLHCGWLRNGICLLDADLEYVVDEEGRWRGSGETSEEKIEDTNR